MRRLSTFAFLPICFILSALTFLTPREVFADGDSWPPTYKETVESHGRTFLWFTHGVAPEWGYPAPQTDRFAIRLPETGLGPHPLGVMLHSAGGGVDESIESVAKTDGCDVYHVPSDFFTLHVDCLEHSPDDWWWGGLNPRLPMDDPQNLNRGGGDLRPVEKRVLATINWVLDNYDIDRNRVYLCGNSMGGSGTLGLGLRHGDLFAAIKANVPAGVLHAANRLYFPPETVPEGVKIPDPPICVDYSAPNDVWSIGHEILYEGMAERKYQIFGYWGNFGHANAHSEINKVNDLIDTFDWLSVRKNEAYPVFTHASTDSPLAWPDQENATEPGQVNAYFRWTVYEDSSERFEIALRLTDAEELGSKIFTPPAESTADVSVRRLQKFSVSPEEKIHWSFAGKQGTVTADENGLVTVPALKIVTVPAILTLTKETESAE